MLRKCRALLNWPRFQRYWALPVWSLLGLARLVLYVVPFVRLASWLGRSSALNSKVPSLDHHQHERARLIGQTVQAVARHTPWLSTCFIQVMAARCLLRWYRVPHATFFGLARGEHMGLEAHAWIAADDVEVTGGRGFDRFVVVACFVNGPADRPHAEGSATDHNPPS